METRHCFLFPILLLAFTVTHAQQPMMRYKADLLTILDDKVYVELQTPGFDTTVVDFLFPRIVPGIYGTMPFAENISNFRAFDKKGRELEVKRPEAHRFRIIGAQNLARISYKVDCIPGKKLPGACRPSNPVRPSGYRMVTHRRIGCLCRDFFRSYVEGSERLPLEEGMLKAGIVVDSQKFNVSLVRNPTPEQAQLRKWWINK